MNGALAGLPILHGVLGGGGSDPASIYSPSIRTCTLCRWSHPNGALLHVSAPSWSPPHFLACCRIDGAMPSESLSHWLSARRIRPPMSVVHVRLSCQLLGAVHCGAAESVSVESIQSLFDSFGGAAVLTPTRLAACNGNSRCWLNCQSSISDRLLSSERSSRVRRESTPSSSASPRPSACTACSLESDVCRTIRIRSAAPPPPSRDSARLGGPGRMPLRACSRACGHTGRAVIGGISASAVRHRNPAHVLCALVGTRVQ